MKRNQTTAIVVTCVLAVLTLAATAGAQTPQKMNYQVMLSDDADHPLADQTVVMVFTIFDAESGGTALWTETQNPTTNSIGVVSVLLGDVSPITIDFDAPCWLEVEVNGETLSPRREIVGAPYALTDEAGGVGDGHSLDADDGAPVDALYVDSDGKVGIGTTTPINELQVEGNARIRSDGPGGAALWVASVDPSYNGVSLYSHDSVGGSIEVNHENGLPAVGMGVSSWAGGGGYLSISGSDSGGEAFSLNGGGSGGGEPRMEITGTASDIVFDLSESQSARVQFPPGAIDSDEIWNEPGVASAQSATPVALTGSGNINQINDCSVYAPGGGYVFVIATAEADIEHSGSFDTSATFGISRASDAFSSNAQETRLFIPMASAVGHYEMSVAVSALFEVPNGTWSFYFVGLEEYGDWEVGARQLTALYIPSSYGTIDTVDEPAMAGTGGHDGIVSEAAAMPGSPELDSSTAGRAVTTEQEVSGLRARVLELERRFNETGR